MGRAGEIPCRCPPGHAIASIGRLAGVVHSHHEAAGACDRRKHEERRSVSSLTRNLVTLATTYVSGDTDLLALVIEDAAADDIPELTRHQGLVRDQLATSLRRRWKELQTPSEPVSREATELREKILNHQGVIFGQAAVALAVHRDAVADLEASARKAGYQFVSMRPYTDGDKPLLAICFARRTGEFTVFHGTLEELRSADEAHAKRGLTLIDIAPSWSKESSFTEPGNVDESRYWAVWQSPQQSETPVSRSAILGIPLVDHFREHDSFQLSGRRVIKHFVVPDSQHGFLAFGILEENQVAPVTNTTRYRPQCASGEVFPSYLQMDVRLMNGPAHLVPPRYEVNRELAELSGGNSGTDLIRRQVWRLRMGKFDSVETELKALTDEYQKNATVVECLATAAAFRGDVDALDAGIDLFVEVAEKDLSALALLRLRRAVSQQDDIGIQTQLDALETLFEANPDNISVLSDIARAYGRATFSSDSERAGEHAKRAIEILEDAWDRNALPITMLEETDFEVLRKRPEFRSFASDNALNAASLNTWSLDETRESRSIVMTSADSHLQRARTLLAEGFLPVCVDIQPRPAFYRTSQGSPTERAPHFSASTGFATSRSLATKSTIGCSSDFARPFGSV